MNVRTQKETSFIELNARERAQALLDEGTFRELLDPFERFESPHLAAQGIVPQSDDGVVVARGSFGGKPAVVISMDGAFQGGGVGEVAGAKMAGALELALRDCRDGKPVLPVLLLNTGGVRLQEGNYGLLAIAEIGAAIVALRGFVPVVSVIPGLIGCFGGMSICAALCSSLVMTKQGRLGLNGPEVIEQEAGIAELDASDRRLIWRTTGGEQRQGTALADMLADDTAEAVRKAVGESFGRGIPPVHRSADVERFLGKLAAIDPAVKIGGETLRTLWGTESTAASGGSVAWLEQRWSETAGSSDSRGRTWFERLSGASRSPLPGAPAVLCADAALGKERVRYIAVAPNPNSRFPRARKGEVGIDEGWTLARHIRDAIEQDAGGHKRAIVAIVDVPSQAYGYMEELLGIHLACAAAVDAYASARLAGHPVIALLVGNAISGAFLAHGLQASRILALDDPGVVVQVMSKTSAARVTRRTVAELEEAARKVPATAYDIKSFASLGAVDELIGGIRADAPEADDVERVRGLLADAIAIVRTGDGGLGGRLASDAARTGRAASIRVRERMAALWN